MDPFDGDPADPVKELAALDDGDAAPQAPMLPSDREQVVEDLADLEVYEALLAPRGLLGLTVDCVDCEQTHYFGWDLLRADLRSLLDSGTTRVHEPAYAPDPGAYVSWDYARGYADANLDAT